MNTPDDPNKADFAVCEQQDLARGSLLRQLLLWWIPIGVIVLSSSATANGHRLPFTVTGILMTTATLWFGVSCYVNGRNCGRVHCRIDGIAMPLLAVVGVLILTKVIAISWGIYAVAFFAVLALSYIPEWFGPRYVKPNRGTH